MAGRLPNPIMLLHFFSPLLGIMVSEERLREARIGLLVRQYLLGRRGCFSRWRREGLECSFVLQRGSKGPERGRQTRMVVEGDWSPSLQSKPGLKAPRRPGVREWKGARNVDSSTLLRQVGVGLLQVSKLSCVLNCMRGARRCDRQGVVLCRAVTTALRSTTPRCSLTRAKSCQFRLPGDVWAPVGACPWLAPAAP